MRRAGNESACSAEPRSGGVLCAGRASAGRSRRPRTEVRVGRPVGGPKVGAACATQAVPYARMVRQMSVRVARFGTPTPESGGPRLKATSIFICPGPPQDLAVQESREGESELVRHPGALLPNGRLLFVSSSRAREILDIRNSTTWEELRKAATSETLNTWFSAGLDDEGEPRADSEPFSMGDYWADCFPFLEQEMLKWMPQDIVSEFGSVATTTLSGNYLNLQDDVLRRALEAGLDDSRSPLLAALRRRGFQCERALLDEVCGY